MGGGGLRPSTQSKYYPFNGGLDVVTPALSVDPGFALAIVNFEPYYNGGYRRVDGYERYDGRAKPSAASAYGATVSALTGLTTGTGTGASGTGSVSGATGQFVEGVTVAGTAYVALTSVTGTWASGDVIVQPAGTSTSTIVTAPSLNYAPVGTGTSGYSYTSEFLANCQAFYRAQIGTVPGTGNVLGQWQNGTNVYAVRATGTGTNANLYVASGTGWTESGITFVDTLYFTSLNTSSGLPSTGSVITGVTSGATGTLYEAITHTTTEGYLALTGVSGTFGTAEGLKVGTAAAWGTSASDCTPFSLPTGFYRWRNYNFFASSSTYNTYGVNGSGPAFQIDESNIVMPILLPQTGQTGQPAANDPFLLEVYQNYLVLAFPGGNFQVSVLGVPYQFNGFLGAEQFGVGAEITGLFAIAGPAMAITTARNTQVLTGNTANTFAMALAAEKAGAIKFSAQLLDTVYALSNLGITSLSRTQVYGNFAGATISQLVTPIVNTLRPNFNDATVYRAANEARFYFNDGSCLIMYIPGLGQQNKAWSAIETGVTAQFGYASYPHPIFNIIDSEDQNNNEVAFFGFSNGDGYVYADRSGTSFDGNAVTSYVRSAFNNIGSPAVRKFFRRADLEINATSSFAFKWAVDLSYSSEESSSALYGLTANDITSVTVFGGGGYWDDVNWNTFYWDGQAISTARTTLAGTGQNVSFLFFHQAITDSPFVLQGLTLYYDPRRLQR